MASFLTNVRSQTLTHDQYSQIMRKSRTTTERLRDKKETDEIADKHDFTRAEAL